ncbi:MAG TPA: PQQ-binding-like beta-propeller repeat protein [Thermomicrobiales bacterium]
MNDGRDLRQSMAFERWWDRLIRGKAAGHEPDLDPGLEAFARRVHALDAIPPADPAFKRRLWEDLMNAHPGTAALPAPAIDLNGRLRRVAPPVVRPPAARVHRQPGRLSTGLSFFATVALVAIVLGMVFFVYRDGQHAALPPAQETPTAVATPAGTWPLYRGNPERNGAMPGPGLRGKPTILWQYNANSPARIAPAVAEGTVFLSPDSDDFVALDATSGTVRWQTRAADGPIAVANGIVYMLSEDVTALIARDTVTAEELWRVTPGSGWWSPLISNGVLYYGGDPNLLISYDAKTGAVRWKSAQQGVASRSAALGDGVLVVGTDDHHVYGIDQATGATKWSLDAGGNGTLQTPSILDGIAYIGYFGDATNSFFALDLQTGQQRWRFDGKSGEGFWAPGASDGLVFVPSDGGRLYAFDAATGQTRWSFEAGVPMKSAPAIVDGIVYAAGDEGILVALDAATGAEQWRFPLDGAVTFGPIIVDGVLYVSTANGLLYALGNGDNTVASPAAGTATSVTPAPTETPVASVAEFVWAAKGSDQAHLSQPLIPRLAPDGSLWVSDSSGRFFIFDLDGNLIDVWGAAGSDPGQFRFVQGGDYGGGFVFAADGSLFVADTFNQRVQHFDRDRNLIGTIGGNGTGDGQFLAPMQIAIGPDGNLAVVDPYRNDVQRFTPDGTFLGRFDGTGTPGGKLDWPNGIAVAADGTIWVGDFYNQSVRHFTPDGQEIGELDASMATPIGFSETNDIFIDVDGYVYVTVQAHNAIKVFDASGWYVGQWGQFGSDDGRFDRPAGIVVNRGGSVYVTDGRNGRVEKFRLTQPWPSPAAATPAP